MPIVLFASATDGNVHDTNPQSLSESELREQKLSERITNWVRVTTERKWPSSHCRSIEHRYRPERLKEEEEAERRAPKWTPDILDAWEVEDAWKQLPDLYKFCLQFVYLKRMKPQAAWRHLRPWRRQLGWARTFDDVLRLARLALLNQLRRRASRESGMRPISES